ncbi:IS66 family insertion sequence element accessory protein TnpA [Paenibacillus sp. B-A-8]|uniref:IS66 family insertion sequence element accessory protein TnpA n=1 Tax=Paenibacillus sp. B-A-8 TaxID=3400419 RepID=UPI003B025220
MTKAERLQDQWTECIRDYRANAFTKSSWFEAQDVTLHQLKYWLRKLDSSMPHTSTPSFIPVTVSPRSPSLPSLTLRFGAASIDVQ